MIAVGNCTGLYPVDPDASEQSCRLHFTKTFAGEWNRLMLGADRPLAYHLYCNVWLEVKELSLGNREPLLDLLKKADKVYYNIMVG